LNGLIECVENGLDRFGENVSKVVCWKLKQAKNIDEEGVIAYPEALVSTIDEIFGVCAPMVKESIAKEIRARFAGLCLYGGELPLLINQVREATISESAGSRETRRF
jgi:hypothetical protein